MTDIHSHILFDVDDGAKNIDESITLLKKLSEIGFKNVILTPHYIKGSEYNSQNKEKITNKRPRSRWDSPFSSASFSKSRPDHRAVLANSLSIAVSFPKL